MGRHDLPPAENMKQNLAGVAYHEIEEYGVYSWCPTHDASGPPEQVHVTFKLHGLEHKLALRFKHPGELDRFIMALQRHREDVWPEKRH